MNRSDKIKLGKYKVADEAAKLYKQALDSLSPLIKSQLIERDKLHAMRETNRNKRDIQISAEERMLRGIDQSREIPLNKNAIRFGVPVARLYEIGAETEPKGFGTGFMIAPNILITNHHVFETKEWAVNCAANFQYERVNKNTISNGINFRLNPDIFFYSNETLDFSLVYVEGNSIQGNTLLESFGLLSLIESKGKVKESSLINIIQYPKGGIKKYTTEDNFVTKIDDLVGNIYYTTDTDVGSSGSPCFNEYWEIAALHFTSIPTTNIDGLWLTKKGEIWNKETMQDDDVDWIANAGKSISKIITNLKETIFSENDNPFIQSILNRSNDPLIDTVEKKIENESIPSKNTNSMSNIVMNFSGQSTIYINQTSHKEEAQEKNLIATETYVEARERKERFDENYENRKGYDEDFISGFKVPFPSVSLEREKELYKNFGATVPFIVPYHHFSLVMNKKRRMLMWSAANVNYNEELRDSRKREDFGSGAWRIDKRIPTKYQIQAQEFYDPATLIDKGHIVRRDDNCWAYRKNGQLDSIGIEYANADTFHWTNCTPQHEAFNRDMAQYSGVGLWGILENEIKKQLDDVTDTNKDYGQRACVLSGPILNDDDPEYLDIQYPLTFWKVFAIRSESEGNLVYGFILSQEDKVKEEGMEKEGKPRFNRKVKAMQISLKEIERQSGVSFDNILHEFDVKGDDADSNDLQNFKRKK